MQVVFAGFSAESLYQRILDCKPNVILTSSAVKRAAKVINLKDIVDDALARASDSGHTVGECRSGRS
jgi:acetyl-CoA synthetase